MTTISSPAADAAAAVTITRIGSQASAAGPADYFTGQVREVFLQPTSITPAKRSKP